MTISLHWRMLAFWWRPRSTHEHWHACVCTHTHTHSHTLILIHALTNQKPKISQHVVSLREESKNVKWESVFVCFVVCYISVRSAWWWHISCCYVSAPSCTCACRLSYKSRTRRWSAGQCSACLYVPSCLWWRSSTGALPVMLPGMLFLSSVSTSCFKYSDYFSAGKWLFCWYLKHPNMLIVITIYWVSCF